MLDLFVRGFCYVRMACTQRAGFDAIFGQFPYDLGFIHRTRTDHYNCNAHFCHFPCALAAFKPLDEGLCI